MRQIALISIVFMTACDAEQVLEDHASVDWNQVNDRSSDTLIEPPTEEASPVRGTPGREPVGRPLEAKTRRTWRPMSPVALSSRSKGLPWMNRHHVYCCGWIYQLLPLICGGERRRLALEPSANQA